MKGKQLSFAVGGIMALACLASLPAVQAATYTWDAGGDGITWSAAQNQNWSLNTVPGSNDIANLTLPSAGAQAITYNTALYPSGGDNLPRTVTIGNTGGGTTTLTVSQDFYTRVVNNASVGGRR